MGVSITRQTSPQKEEVKRFSEHKVTIVNRKNLSITGVTDVNSTSEAAISVVTVDGPLLIAGRNLHVLKIAVEDGVVEAEGTVTELKYLEKKEKQSLVKKIFK